MRCQDDAEQFQAPRHADADAGPGEDRDRIAQRFHRACGIAAFGGHFGNVELGDADSLLHAKVARDRQRFPVHRGGLLAVREVLGEVDQRVGLAPAVTERLTDREAFGLGRDGGLPVAEAAADDPVVIEQQREPVHVAERAEDRDREVVVRLRIRFFSLAGGDVAE
ncbi:MAG: hypothetical protein H0U10_04480, partial [Chloroflexia bacterium]|nr:hypothetical protein [Chloroflexia bacterium]